ncbi:AidA/PixA family protein [Pseudomonas sp. H11T01]|uniref:AidA/PixA family protein n=1 Tax=Pseudomonas sp. H11T01 TaxID=3402749 RepID=UPI003AD56B69
MSADTLVPPSKNTEPANNVSLIVDAETLLSRYPQPSLEPDSPTVIDDEFIFVAGGTQTKKSVKNDSLITLTATNGKTFHIRGRTVGLQAEHSVVFYDITVGDAGVLSPPQLIVHSGLTLPAPNPENPTQPVSQKADDHYWQCMQLAAGVEKCELSFMVVNTSCEAVGYFSWVLEVKLAG